MGVTSKAKQEVSQLGPGASTGALATANSVTGLLAPSQAPQTILGCIV